MSHQGTDRLTGSVVNHQALKQALDWLLESARFSGLAFRGDCTWSPKAFISTAILWACSGEKTLTERFFMARKIVVVMGILTRTPATSYQAFLKMLNRWTVWLAVVLVAAFRQRMQTDLADRFKVAGFPVFGTDGSRLDLPRTESNETRFSPAKTQKSPKANGKGKSRGKARGQARSRAARARRARQKKASCPQMWLTLLFHVGSGLPWDWRAGPSDSSERGHLLQMLHALPANALITADAGFVGYAVWKAILDSGRHLVIRVGANVRLLKQLGCYVEEKRGLVYLWPDREAKRKQPPLVLRLVVVHNGKHPVYLVTSILDEATLSDNHVAKIYALRWGVEVFYRHFKQTFERRKLRSHTADHAELEATWSLLGLWAMGLHVQATQGTPPGRISVAKVLLAYRRAMHEYKNYPDRGESLSELLAKALTDEYQRGDKSSRDQRQKKQHHKIGKPKVTKATKAQVNAAKAFRNQPVLGLTA